MGLCDNPSRKSIVAWLGKALRWPLQEVDMGTYIPEEKARLRDEVELAVMAWEEAGREITRLPASRAPVCVPGGAGHGGALVRQVQQVRQIA